MRLHPSAYAQDELEEIVRDPEGSGERIGFRLYLGDKDISADFDTGSLSVGADALPWTFSSNLVGRIPVSLLNAPVRLWMEAAGIMMPMFEGSASYPSSSAEWATDLSALTPGHKMDKDTLDEYIQFSGVTPQRAIREAFRRVPDYDMGRVDVARFNTPLIYRIRGDAPAETKGGSWASGFEDEDTPKSLLDSINTEVNAVSIDTPYGRGSRTRKDPGVGEGLEVVWDYDPANSDVIEPFLSPDWASPDDQFTHVVARHKLENGDLAYYRAWEVDYTTLEYPPTGRRSMYIAMSDASPESIDKAREEAIRSARALGRGLWQGNITVAFNPFLDIHDVITIAHDHEDSSGKYRRIWRCIIDGIDYVFGTSELALGLSFRAVLLQDREIEEAPIRIHRLSPGIVAVPGEGIAYGRDAIGDWIDPAKLLGVPWAGVEVIDGVTYGWFDPALAPPGVFATDEGGVLYINMPESISAVGRDETGDWVDPTLMTGIPWAGEEVINGVTYGWFDPDLAPTLFGVDENGPYVEVP